MIIKTVNKFIASRLLVACVVATVVFSGPVILISLCVNLPNEALFTGLALAALKSIAPMILYHTLPVLAAGAIIWSYSQFWSDGVLVTMHLAGLSHLSVRAPAFSVAIGAMTLGYVLSCWVAPSTATYLHEVLFSLRHEMSPTLLRVGQFNTIDGRQVIFFRRWLNDNEIADVFIREYTAANEERVYAAKRAVFQHDTASAKGGLALFDGSVQALDGEKTTLRNLTFDRLLLPSTALGDGARPSTFVDELGLLGFLQERENSFKNPAEARSWMREAIKRFGIPVLALIHTLLGLELLERLRSKMREQYSVALISALIASVHFTVVVAAEQTGLVLAWAWVAIALIGAELALAVALMIIRTDSLVMAAKHMAFNRLDWRQVVLPALLSSSLDGDDAPAPVALGPALNDPHRRYRGLAGHDSERESLRKIA
jgi:lipopolysaccharide export system permease protein